MRSWWRTFPVHFECDQPFPRAVSFRFQQFVASGELAFLKIDEKSETGFDRIALGRKIGAIERITHFQAQCVARAQTTGLRAEFFSALQNEVPQLRCILRTKKNFHAVFAGITGPRDRDRHVFSNEIAYAISCWKLDILAQQLVKEIDHARSLNGDAAKVCAAIP